MKCRRGLDIGLCYLHTKAAAGACLSPSFTGRWACGSAVALQKPPGEAISSLAHSSDPFLQDSIAEPGAGAEW